MRKHRYARYAALALGLLVAAWFVPSWLSAERFRKGVERRLLQSLGRPVQFRHIAFELVPHPGFSIDDLSVLEDPAFGSEPLARVDHVDCGVGLRDVVRGRLQVGYLRLEGAAINLVRAESHQWNVEPLVARAAPSATSRGPAPALDVEVADARVNFVVNGSKKPFTITGVEGHLSLDAGRGALQFSLTGSPLRTDLVLPSPGKVEFAGSWTPGLPDSLHATLRARKAMLYDWIPLVWSRNPEIYGLVDFDGKVNGSPNLLNVDATLTASQLRRWESLPPANDLPLKVTLKAHLDRSAGEADFDGLDAAFGSSHLKLSGTLLNLGAEPSVRIASRTDAARVEDFAGLVGRLTGRPASWAAWTPLAITGTLDGNASIEGTWSEPRVLGSATMRDGALALRGSRLPIGLVKLRMNGRSFELLPARIEAAPNFSVLAEGEANLWGSEAEAATPGNRPAPRRRPPAPAPPGYRLTLSAHAAPAREIINLARKLGLGIARNLDANGPVSAELSLAGNLSPITKPAADAVAELRSTELAVPGLTEPLLIQSAHVQMHGGRWQINPISASLGQTVLTGRLEHSGARGEPWVFDLHAPSFDINQAAAWFEAFGHPSPLPWLDLIPGMGTLTARRSAGSGLFTALNARGEFSTATLAARRLTLTQFQTHIDVSRRVFRASSATFRIDAGRGEGSLTADLTGGRPHLGIELAVSGLRVEHWSAHLPRELAEVRGTGALSGRFTADGVGWQQIQSALTGEGSLRLNGLELGHFDPARAAARSLGWGDLSSLRGPATVRSAELAFTVHDREAVLKPVRFSLNGATFDLGGKCGFDGQVELEAAADLTHPNRRWVDEKPQPRPRTARFLLTGPLDSLRAVEAPATPATAEASPR